MSISFYPSIHAHFNKCIEALNNYDLTSAYRHLQAAYKPLSRLDSKNSKWAVYYLNLSTIYNNSGRFWESIECCHEAQEIFLEGGYLHLAIDHFRQAERYFREIDYKPGLIEAIYERANTYLSLGMVDKSRELINRIQSMIPKESPWRFFLLRLKYCISNREEQFEQAIDYARKLHHFYARAGDKKGQADSLEMLGSSFYNLSNMQEAEKYGKQALELAKEIGDKLIEAQSQQLLKAIGELNKASRG